MKKISLILFFISLLSCLSFAHDIEITDIEDHWAEVEIENLIHEGVINGYLDGTFRPDVVISRGEFIKLCVTSLADFQYDEFGMYAYWEQPYLKYAKDKKIIENSLGYDYTKPITREEMARITIKTLELFEIITEVDNFELEFKFEDYNKIASYNDEYILSALAMGLLTGKPNNRFDPTGFATRAEASVVINRLKDKSSREKIDFDLPFFKESYIEYLDDEKITRELLILATKDINGLLKSDIVDLFKIGEDFIEKNNLTVNEEESKDFTEDFKFESSYNPNSKSYHAKFYKLNDEQVFINQIELILDHEELVADGNPYLITFYKNTDWIFHDENVEIYEQALDLYYTYLFEDDKVYVKEKIQEHMDKLKENIYSSNATLDESIILNNGREVNFYSTGEDYRLRITNIK